MNIFGVIFDMDGVIFDTERLWKDAFVLSNKKYGLQLSEGYRQSTCGKSEIIIRQELKELYPALNVDEYRNGMLNYVNEHINNGSFNVKSGFLDTVEFLKGSGFKTALATSSHKDRAERLFSLKNIDIKETFDAVVFAEDIGKRSKPDPYIFLKAADILSIPPETCFVVEDSINGIEAAVKGKFIPVMVRDLIPPDEFCLNNAKAVINDLTELKSIVLGK